MALVVVRDVPANADTTSDALKAYVSSLFSGFGEARDTYAKQKHADNPHPARQTGTTVLGFPQPSTDRMVSQIHEHG